MNPHQFWTNQYNIPRRHEPIYEVYSPRMPESYSRRKPEIYSDESHSLRIPEGYSDESYSPRWPQGNYYEESYFNRKPKVVRVIPVQSSESERTRSLSAARIQRVWRGFRVRRSVRKIKEISREVDEVERKVKEKETVERIKRDEKERLKVNEMLMGLLLRLDGVKGVDDGVRVCRKMVTKRVVALQERVDSIVVGDETRDSEENDDGNLIEVIGDAVEAGENDSGEVLVRRQEDEANMEMAIEDRLEDSDGVKEENCNANVKQVEEIRDPLENEECSDVELVKTEELRADEGSAEMVDVKEDEAQAEVVEMADGDNLENEECPDAVEDYAAGCLQEDTVVLSSNEDDAAVIVDAYESVDDCGFGREESPGDHDSDLLNITNLGRLDENVAKSEGEIQPLAQERQLGDDTLVGESKKNRELLEKMMEENEKMMTMMTQLFEKSEKQTLMLSSLTKRVELLEKAFMCDLLRRKKKKSLP